MNSSSRIVLVFLTIIALLPGLIWLFNRPKTRSPLGDEGGSSGERVIFEEKLKPTREPTPTEEPSETPTPTKKPRPTKKVVPTETPAATLEPTINTAPQEATGSGE